MKLIQLATQNSVLDGELLEDHPWVYVWTERYKCEDTLPGRDHFALEAWERQTTGGVRVTRISSPIMPEKDRCWTDLDGVSPGFYAAR